MGEWRREWLGPYMTIGGRLMAAMQSARQAWREYGSADIEAAQIIADRYALLGAFYSGSWRNDPRWPWPQVSDNVYRGGRQVVKATAAIIDVYEQLTWRRATGSDGGVLPDGTRGALPLVGRTGAKATDEAVLRAFYENFEMWSFRSQMGLIPKTAAIFGDALVELIDDYPRGAVRLNIMYPGYAPDVDLVLDHEDHIKQYAVEFDVDIPESKAFGRVQKAEQYRYRKEVDGEAFRYYREGKPYRYPWLESAVVPNPYGFVPAVWFRHEKIAGSNRGIGAYEKTLLQAVEINGTLSSAIDQLRLQLGAPVGVIDGMFGVGGQTLTMPPGLNATLTAGSDAIEQARRDAAQNLNLISMGEKGKFVTVEFDLGETHQMMTFLYERLVAENPEAELASKLFGLTQATGPGMQRILSPIVGRITRVQDLHDPRLLDLQRMSTAIMGYRLKNNDIPKALVNARPARFQPFAPFDLSSYGQGLLEAETAHGDVFPESNAEKVQWLTMAADLPPWGLRRLGLSETEITEIEGERDRRTAEQMAAFSVAAAGPQQASADEQDQGDQQGTGQPATHKNGGQQPSQREAGA